MAPTIRKDEPKKDKKLRSILKPARSVNQPTPPKLTRERYELILNFLLNVALKNVEKYGGWGAGLVLWQQELLELLNREEGHGEEITHDDMYAWLTQVALPDIVLTLKKSKGRRRRKKPVATKRSRMDEEETLPAAKKRSAGLDSRNGSQPTAAYENESQPVATTQQESNSKDCKSSGSREESGSKRVWFQESANMIRKFYKNEVIGDSTEHGSGSRNGGGELCAGQATDETNTGDDSCGQSSGSSSGSMPVPGYEVDSQATATSIPKEPEPDRPKGEEQTSGESGCQQVSGEQAAGTASQRKGELTRMDKVRLTEFLMQVTKQMVENVGDKTNDLWKTKADILKEGLLAVMGAKGAYTTDDLLSCLLQETCLRDQDGKKEQGQEVGGQTASKPSPKATVCLVPPPSTATDGGSSSTSSSFSAGHPEMTDEGEQLERPSSASKGAEQNPLLDSLVVDEEGKKQDHCGKDCRKPDPPKFVQRIYEFMSNDFRSVAKKILDEGSSVAKVDTLAQNLLEIMRDVS